MDAVDELFNNGLLITNAAGTLCLTISSNEIKGSTPAPLEVPILDG